jgi:hypothetical protein
LERRARNRAEFAAARARDRAAARARLVVPPPGADEPPPPHILGLDYYASLERFEEFCRDCLVIVTKQGQLSPLLLNSSQSSGRSAP